MRSSLFLFLSFHFPSRIHCLYQWLLKIYHRKIRNDEYAPIAANNMFLMLVVSGIFGRNCILLEKSQSKQSDIALFSLWRLIELYVLKLANINNLNYEKDNRNRILASNQLPAILFALACGIVVYVNASDPTALKSLEKAVLKYALA